MHAVQGTIDSTCGETKVEAFSEFFVATVTYFVTIFSSPNQKDFYFMKQASRKA